MVYIILSRLPFFLDFRILKLGALGTDVKVDRLRWRISFGPIECLPDKLSQSLKAFKTRLSLFPSLRPSSAARSAWALGRNANWRTQTLVGEEALMRSNSRQVRVKAGRWGTDLGWSRKLGAPVGRLILNTCFRMTLCVHLWPCANERCETVIVVATSSNSKLFNSIHVSRFRHNEFTLNGRWTNSLILKIYVYRQIVGYCTKSLWIQVAGNGVLRGTLKI